MKIEAMNYEMEELVPVVAELAERYTSSDSTSVTWEKAEQLMEAVLYCIHELEITQHNAVISQDRTGDRMSAQQAYRMGLRCVEKKAKTALELYNSILPGFLHYGNRCLYDTVVKGLPEFFKWYDVLYEPQNTLLTLDYPVLSDLSGYTGIDKIYEYLCCICLEQSFLNRFPENYVQDILAEYDRSYRDMIENICEIVLTEVIRYILLRKPMTQRQWDENDCNRLKEILTEKNTGELTEYAEREVQSFLTNHFENGSDLYFYLAGAVRGIIVRMKT